jgi:tripartite-type tricarboxylate transporter receptor subunit TctC
VENKAGASGSIGSDFVAKAAPDGYTLVLGNNASHGAYELLNPKNATYRTLRDFAPVALFGIAPLIMISRSTLDVKNIKEYVAYAKANPQAELHNRHRQLTAFRRGTAVQHRRHRSCTSLQRHGAGIAGTASGSVDSTWCVQRHGPGQGAGPARLLGRAANGTASDLPTLAEQGFPGVEYDSWYGLLAPAAVPAAILDKINADTNRGMGGDEIGQQLLARFRAQARSRSSLRRFGEEGEAHPARHTRGVDKARG